MYFYLYLFFFILSLYLLVSPSTVLRISYGNNSLNKIKVYFFPFKKSRSCQFGIYMVLHVSGDSDLLTPLVHSSLYNSSDRKLEE